MTASALEFATLHELASLLAKKKVSPVELARLYLARIEDFGPRLAAFITVTPESAFAEARAAERRTPPRTLPRPAARHPPRSQGQFLDARRAHQRRFDHPRRFRPGRRIATSWFRWLGMAPGAVLLRQNSTCTNSPTALPARTPTTARREIPGRSGEFPAAPAAARRWPPPPACAPPHWARTPAAPAIRVLRRMALCGIVGLKPTFGRISCHGVVPLVRSFDHVGILTRSVADAALLLQALGGYDPLDPRQHSPSRKRSGMAKKPRGTRKRKKWRLGWPREFFWSATSDLAVRRLAEAAVQSLVKQGATLKEISLPTIGAAVELREPRGHRRGSRAYHQNAGLLPGARAAEYGRRRARPSGARRRSARGGLSGGAGGDAPIASRV